MSVNNLSQSKFNLFSYEILAVSRIAETVLWEWLILFYWLKLVKI